MATTAVSLAKVAVVDSGEVGRSQVYNRYNNGPRTLPWGTPALTDMRLNANIFDGNRCFLSSLPTLCFPKLKYFKYIIGHNVHYISIRRCWSDVNEMSIHCRHWQEILT
jgi:hypothetical protein